MTSSDYKKILIILRAVMIIIAVLIVVVLVAKDVALSGKFVAEHDFQNPSPFFTDLVPKQRVEQADGVSKMNAEPIYTTLRFPRPFETLDLSIAFENPDDLFVEMGPQVSVPESYSLRALNHPALNKVFEGSSEWEPAVEDDTSGSSRLYQKRSAQYIYKNKHQLFEGLPAISEVGYYGVEWEKPFLPEFAEESAGIEIDTPLRGSHEFYVAINQDKLDFSINYQDVNNNEGADKVVLQISDWQGNLIEEQTNSDDGEKGERGATSSKQQAAISVGDLEFPAVYRVSIKATEDIFIHELSTSAPYLVVKQRISLAAANPDFVKEFGDKFDEVDLYSSAREWTALTTHRDTVHNIKMVTESFSLAEPLTDYTYSLSDDQRFALENGYLMTIEKPNVVIQGRGVFAFSQEQYFSPLPWYIDHTVDLDELLINYVVADYRPPSKDDDDFYHQMLNIDISKVFAPAKSLRFQLSIPEFQDHHTFAIKNMKAQYESEAVTIGNAWDKFVRFWEREVLN